MQLVNANGLNFVVEIAGKGEPLLFLGGTGSDLRKKPNPLDSVLAQYFTVLMFDQRGMGQSDKPVGPYSMADYANDAAAILDFFGWDSAHVAGYSFGGMVAQELAIRFPEKVRSLSLVVSAAGGEGGSSYPIHEFIDLPPRDAAIKSLEVADQSFTRQWRQDNPLEAQQRIENTMVNATKFIGEPNALLGLKAQLGARAEHNTYDRLHLISAPTMVLAGDRDGQAPASIQKIMSDKIPNAVFQVIEGSHYMIAESEQVFKHIKQHIEGSINE